MRKGILVVWLFISSLSVFSQSKFEVGLTTEASWIMKNELTMSGHVGEKDSWGAGLGVYAALPVWWRFSLSSGVGLRYAQMQKGTAIYTQVEDSERSVFSGYDFTQYDRYYTVVPLNLNFRLAKSLLLSGGIEYCKMLDKGIESDSEFNWTTGIGSHIYKLKWNIKYLYGFNEHQVSEYYTETDGSQQTLKLYRYRTSRVQLNLSYPLWSK